ncbi:MAG: DUF308 domain-containing protein [Clostridia bacterium]|nr:DUF308 domain-containing protein [Clostridia bacterium]
MEVIGQGKQKFDWYSLLAALIMIIIGVTILIWPEQTGAVLVYVLGGAVTAAGLVRTILYFSRSERTSPFSFGGLTVGLTLVAVGALLLVKPDILRNILSVVLGCLLIFSGFGSLQTAVELLRLKIDKWWIPLIFALIAIVCGVIAVAELINVPAALMIFLGVALCVEGLLLIVSLCLFHKKVRV